MYRRLLDRLHIFALPQFSHAHFLSDVRHVQVEGCAATACVVCRGREAVALKVRKLGEASVVVERPRIRHADVIGKTCCLRI